LSYVGHTREEGAAMLAEIGVASFDDLLAQIPERFRLTGLLALPPALSETELRRLFAEHLSHNYDPAQTPSFLGGGIYDHAIPAAVDGLSSRAEFSTAYTPYQAEVAQGTLAAIFEFQTMICELTGMDVANASMYDGASAAAEAVLLARAANKGTRVLLPETVHPRTRGVVATYLDGTDCRVELIPERDGRLDGAALAQALEGGDRVAALIVQQPNFYGCLEALAALPETLRAGTPRGPHLIVSADPLSLGLLAPPALFGAQTVVGDLQPLGIPPQGGGPTGGYFATRQAWIRRLPGRLVAEARDAAGRRGFTLTLQTREQHIRRDKATSNICTNSALLMLRATIYLALVGPQGLREVAGQCLARGRYARRRLGEISGVTAVHGGPWFREFVLRLPQSAEQVVARVLDEAGILAGIPLARFDPARERELLVAVTEKRSCAEIDALVAALSAVLAGAPRGNGRTGERKAGG